MPFGLDLKSVIVGVLFILFVYPFLANLFLSRKPAKADA